MGLIIDLSYYEKVAEEDKGFIIQMINTFMEDVPEMVKRIKEAADENNTEEVKKMVHKLKPSWSMSGIDVVIIEKVEEIIRNGGSPELIMKQVEAIVQVSEKAMKEMEAALSALK